jgi:hypothetical protein
VFEIEKEAPDPWREVLLKEVTLGTSRRWNAAVGKACHDFTKNCGVILRLRTLGCYLDTDTSKRFPQSCERTSI